MSLKARWLASSVQCPTWNSPCLVASCVTICAGERSRSRTCLLMPPPSTSSFRPWSGWRRQAGGLQAGSSQSTEPLRGQTHGKL